MPSTTDTATHVYLKKDNPKGLLQSYTGPHKIVDRPSYSTIKVKVGTFKSGVDNIQLHHWSNAKPALVRAGAEEAQMPVRGRPKKQPDPDTSVKSDVQPTTEVAYEAANGKRAAGRKNAAGSKQTPAPTRRSERLQAKSHATSSTERPQQFRSAPQVMGKRENSNHLLKSRNNE